MESDHPPEINPAVLAQEQQQYEQRGARRDRERHPLLSLRSAFILTMALLVALGAGGLLYAAHHSIAQAVLGAGAAFAATATFLNWVIELRSGRGGSTSGRHDVRFGPVVPGHRILVSVGRD